MADPERRTRFSPLFPLNLVWRGMRGLGVKVGGGVSKYYSKMRDKQRTRRSRTGRGTGLASISSVSLDDSEGWASTEPCSNMFPTLLFPKDEGAAKKQNLLTVGTRHWGNWWDGRGLLGVRLYDFAIYIDGQEARQSAGPAITSTGRRVPSDLYQRLRSGQFGNMSIVLRASRSLPLHLLSQEFERILQRRLQRVGGNPEDPALASFLDCFSEDRVPSTAKEGTSVKKGSTITFIRKGGELVTATDGIVLGQLQSTKLGDALFDLYLGEEPVSKKAREIAGENFLLLANDPNHVYHPPGSKYCDSEVSCAVV